MGSLKSLTLLALLLSFSLGVFAETSNDSATHGADGIICKAGSKHAIISTMGLKLFHIVFQM
ncbi:hypothetical protein F2Q68_00001779 [Brassica cretica]|uniref:Uncharacterized protein n=1 Tax=Brassica cretica TaxID=69181 RepID=A0A8S9JKF9_BRACR|nr:hypothetical protein F2Q68_00001779 [Brassica cretica]